jgi:choline dehydrogenase
VVLGRDVLVRQLAADAAEPPSIVFNHLEARQDAADLVDGVRLARSIARQGIFGRSGATELVPGPDVENGRRCQALPANMGG